MFLRPPHAQTTQIKVVRYVLKGCKVPCKVKTATMDVKTASMDTKTATMDDKTASMIGSLKVVND